MVETISGTDFQTELAESILGAASVVQRLQAISSKDYKDVREDIVIMMAKMRAEQAAKKVRFFAAVTYQVADEVHIQVASHGIMEDRIAVTAGGYTGLVGAIEGIAVGENEFYLQLKRENVDHLIIPLSSIREIQVQKRDVVKVSA